MAATTAVTVPSARSDAATLVVAQRTVTRAAVE